MNLIAVINVNIMVHLGATFLSKVVVLAAAILAFAIPTRDSARNGFRSVQERDTPRNRLGIY